MKLFLIILLILPITLIGQTKKDSIRWQKLAEQRIKAGKDSVYQQLLRSKKIDYYLNPPKLSYSTREFYTEASKQLLMEVLKDEWMTEAQKNTLAKQLTSERIEREIVTSEAIVKDTVKYSGFSKNRRQHFREHADSLKRLNTFLDADTVINVQTLIQFYINQINEREMPKSYIYAAGMLDDARFIPVLKEVLGDTLHYDSYAVKMALARYLLEPYYGEMLEISRIKADILKKGKSDKMARSYQYYKTKPLFYIMTQASIKEYAKLLELEHFDRIDQHDYSIYSVPSRVLADLSVVVFNEDFQSYISIISLPDDVEMKHINWVQNWLEENYGNYKLNRDYYPGF